jgi:hypothetical protein
MQISNSFVIFSEENLKKNFVLEKQINEIQKFKDIYTKGRLI